jgi:hypothetical protein
MKAQLETTYQWRRSIERQFHSGRCDALKPLQKEGVPSPVDGGKAKGDVEVENKKSL